MKIILIMIYHHHQSNFDPDLPHALKSNLSNSDSPFHSIHGISNEINFTSTLLMLKWSLISSGFYSFTSTLLMLKWSLISSGFYSFTIKTKKNYDCHDDDCLLECQQQACLVSDCMYDCLIVITFCMDLLYHSIFLFNCVFIQNFTGIRGKVRYSVALFSHKIKIMFGQKYARCFVYWCQFSWKKMTTSNCVNFLKLKMPALSNCIN